MGSLAAMKEGKGSRQRYDQDNVKEDDLVPQGIEGIVPLAGTVKKIMTQFCGGLRSSLGYCGARTIDDLKRDGLFCRITGAGVRGPIRTTSKLSGKRPTTARNVER